MEQSALGLKVRLHTDFETAEQRVIAALKAQGFGVLTDIDVKATLKEKLDVDVRPYRILGACNPPLAHRALETAPDVGLLLPCNVTLTETEPGAVDVSAIDPLIMLGVVPSGDLEAVAQEAHQRLRAVIESLEA